MEEIKAYKTTDGQVFEDKDEGTAHQADIDYKNKIVTLLENIWYRGIELEDVVNFLSDHRDEL